MMTERNPKDNPLAAILAAITNAAETGKETNALIALYQKEQANTAKREFFTALSAFQAKLPPIPKKQTARIITQKGNFSYSYADLGAIFETISGLLGEHGFSVSFDTNECEHMLTVICTVQHVAGHTLSATFPVPIDRAGRMNAAQSVGSALTYGRRYALTAALGIVTADEDNDAVDAPDINKPVPTITQEQVEMLVAKIDSAGLDRQRVGAWIKKAWDCTINDLNNRKARILEERITEWAQMESEGKEQ